MVEHLYFIDTSSWTASCLVHARSDSNSSCDFTQLEPRGGLTTMVSLTPLCTTCNTPVYHAEQVMGPARKIYHKPCLRCTHCSKRQDPGGLVEHDSMPYCSLCHKQLFGTRDLRHGNLHAGSPAKVPSGYNGVESPAKGTPIRGIGSGLVSGTSTPRGMADSPLKNVTPIRGPEMGSTPTLIRGGRPLPQPPADFYTPPRLDSSGWVHSVDSQAYASADEVTRPNFRSERPISVPFAGSPARVLDDRGLLRRGDSPRSKVGERVLLPDDCWGCGARVYAAEQVYSIGHK